MSGHRGVGRAARETERWAKDQAIEAALAAEEIRRRGPAAPERAAPDDDGDPEQGHAT